MLSTKLTASELKCLSIIAKHGRTQISQMSKELHVMPPHISRIVGGLQEKDFVRIERTGLSKAVSLSEAKHAILWRKLAVEFFHMSWDDLLSGSSLEVLSAISFLQLKSRKEIAKLALVSEPSVENVLLKLRKVGIVQKTDSIYNMSPRFQVLKEFVVEFRHYLNEKIALEFAGDAVILWECNKEFVIESTRSEEGNGFRLTGLSTFAGIGVPLMVPKSYFFYSPFVRKLRLEDVVLHSLLVDGSNMLQCCLYGKNKSG